MTSFERRFGWFLLGLACFNAGLFLARHLA